MCVKTLKCVFDDFLQCFFPTSFKILFMGKSDIICIWCKPEACKFPKDMYHCHPYHVLEIYKPPLKSPSGPIRYSILIQYTVRIAVPYFWSTDLDCPKSGPNFLIGLHWVPPTFTLLLYLSYGNICFAILMWYRPHWWKSEYRMHSKHTLLTY